MTSIINQFDINNQINQNVNQNNYQETPSRCEDDFNVLSTIFTDLIYNTIYNMALAKNDINSNIRLEDLYIASLKNFSNDIKKYDIFKKIIIHFIKTSQIHTDYQHVKFEATIYRLFNHFILDSENKYKFEQLIKFLNTLFANIYSKFIQKIISSEYIKIILFDRQNIKYHQELQTVFYDILISEKKIFQTPTPVKYDSKINTLHLINENEQLKNDLIKLTNRYNTLQQQYNTLENKKQSNELNEQLKNQNLKLSEDNKQLVLMYKNLKKEYTDNINILQSKIQSLEINNKEKPQKQTKPKKEPKKESPDNSEEESEHVEIDTDFMLSDIDSESEDEQSEKIVSLLKN